MIQNYLVSALVFYLPFLVLPIGISYFETPKAVAAEVGVELLFIITLWQGNLKGFKRLNLLPFLLLFSLTLYGLVINPDLKLFFGNIFRLQGVFLLWHLLLFALLSSKINVEKKGTTAFILLGALLTLTLVGFILGIHQEGRAVGTLGEPNSLSAVALFFLPFVLLQKRWVFQIIALVVVLETILLAGSRSGLFALLLTLIFLLLSHHLILGVKKASIVGFLLLVIGFSFPLIEGGGWFENRSEIWQTAYVAGWSSPILGNGFGNVQSALSKTAIKLNNNVQYQIVDSSHNIFLDFWVQGGIIGLFLFLLILMISIYNLLLFENRLMIALLLGLLASLSFNPLSVSVLIMFWWVIGQGYKTKASTTE